MELDFFTVDFETCTRRRDVMAFSAAVVRYPTGEILRSITRHFITQGFDEPSQDFWSGEAKGAFDVHMNRTKLDMYNPGGAVTAFRDLVRWFDDVRRDFPSLIMIGDNPSFDYDILDSILIPYRSTRSCFRADGSFVQPVCTYSIGMMRPAFGPSRHRPIEIPPEGSVPHTPDYDVYRTIGRFFQVLDANPDLAVRLGARNGTSSSE